MRQEERIAAVPRCVIAEVENAGKSDEREESLRAMMADSCGEWKRGGAMEERDGGVYVQSEGGFPDAGHSSWAWGG